MDLLEWTVVWEKEYVTIRYNPQQKLVWSEWRGVIPGMELREAMVYNFEFIIANDVEYLIEDYSCMSAPSMDDQVWISNHTAVLLHHSKLRRVANLMAQDLFQQIGMEYHHETTAKITVLCESRDFVTKDEALEWLFS